MSETPQPPKIDETFYYKVLSSTYIYDAVLIGETSRSWLIGSRWSPSKLSKKTTVLCSKEEFDLFAWANKNKYKIACQVEAATPEQLQKIAAIVEYEESK